MDLSPSQIGLWIQGATLAVTLIWLWVTYRVLIANEKAVAEAKAANEMGQKALSAQALLSAYPPLYIGAREEGEGDSLYLELYVAGDKPAISVEALVFSYDYSTWTPLDTDEPVDDERYEARSRFSVPVLLPGRRYAVRARVGGRSAGKVVLVQFSDSLGRHYVERYDFGMSASDPGRLPFSKKYPGVPTPVERWRVVGETDPEGEKRASLVVPPEVTEDVVPRELRDAVGDTTVFALTWASVAGDLDDWPL